MQTTDIGVLLTGVGTLIAVVAAAFGQVSKARATSLTNRDSTVAQVRRGRRILAEVTGELLDIMASHRCVEGGKGVDPPDDVDERLAEAMKDK